MAQDLDSREVLSFALKRLLKKKNKIPPSTYHYFLGNIYYCRAKSNTRDKTMKSYLDDKYFHKARHEFLNVNVVDEHYSKAMTNAAQILNQTGRMWESIELYNTILQKNPNFGMVLGSKAQAMDYYLRQLKQLPYRLIHDIHRLLEQALNDPQVITIGGSDAVNGFTQKLAEYAELMGEQKNIKRNVRNSQIIKYSV